MLWWRKEFLSAIKFNIKYDIFLFSILDCLYLNNQSIAPALTSPFNGDAEGEKYANFVKQGCVIKNINANEEH